jgi:hypothetical protein
MLAVTWNLSNYLQDDILTISKLDSGLLVITPVDAQPESIVKHAVKMFDAEAKAAKVALHFPVAQTYRDMDVDWVSLDPTRLLQVRPLALPDILIELYSAAVPPVKAIFEGGNCIEVKRIYS